MRRTLDYDPMTGLHTWHDYDHATKVTTIGYHQDVAPFIEANKEVLKEPSYRQRGMRESFLHAARIPIGVQYEWLKKGISLYRRDDNKKVRQLLNSPDYAYLRTTRGKL